jgi:hypothetical protein
MKSRNNIYDIVAILIGFVAFQENIGSLRYYILAVLVPFGFLLILFRNSINNVIIIKTIMLCSAFLVLAVPSLLEVFPHKSNFNYSIIDYSSGVLVKVITIAIMFSLLRGSRHRIENLIKWILIINVSFFFLQFVTVYLTGLYLDPIEIITGTRQRYLSNFSIPIIGNIYRPTGFYEEPSTYAAFIVCLIAIKYYLSPTVDRVVKLSLLSVVLSLSVASIIYGSFLSLIFISKSKGSYMKYLFYLLLPIAGAILIYLALSRINATESATDLRMNLLLAFSNQNIFEILLGNGMLGVIPSLAEYMSTGYLWKVNVASLNDNGLWLFIAIKLGLVGLISIIVFYFQFNKSTINRSLFITLLLTKLSFLYFSIIIYIFVILYFKEEKYD